MKPTKTLNAPSETGERGGAWSLPGTKPSDEASTKLLQMPEVARPSNYEPQVIAGYAVIGRLNPAKPSEGDERFAAGRIAYLAHGKDSHDDLVYVRYLPASSSEDRRAQFRYEIDVVKNLDPDCQFLPRWFEAQFDHLVEHTASVDARAATKFEKDRGDGGYYVMEYVRGESLATIAPDYPLLVVVHVGTALAALHSRQIVHHDLSPKNVVKDQATGKYILVDFDAAIDLSNYGPEIERRGTPNFTPPGSEPVGPGWDVWALGAVLRKFAKDREEVALADWMQQGVETRPSAAECVDRAKALIARGPSGMGGTQEIPRAMPEIVPVKAPLPRNGPVLTAIRWSWIVLVGTLALLLGLAIGGSV